MEWEQDPFRRAKTFFIPIQKDSINKTAMGKTYSHDMSVEVTCKDCLESFPASELKSYYEETEDLIIDSHTVCPRCGEIHCCRLRYELMIDENS